MHSGAIAPTKSELLPISDPAPNGTPGNLVAANAWLARVPTNADTFPSPGVIDSQNLSSVRHIKDIRDNDTLVTLWGAKDADDGICLITGIPGGIFDTQCALPNDFAAHGITGGFNGIEVSWDGVSTSVTLPMSGLRNY